MEWYKGKPIMYGLGHFVFDLVLEWSEEFKKGLAELLSNSFFDTPYTSWPREGWPYLPMHEDTRMTILAYATASKNGIEDIGFLPCKLTPDGKVNPLELGSADSDAVVRYLEKANETQGLRTRFVAEGSISLGSLSTLRAVGS
jgi:poly-gamma-glutamate synthesis protein (capsule biosynthesis protein)